MNASPLLSLRESARSSSADGRSLPDRVAVQSRLLASIAYDPDQFVLQLEFLGGTIYQYFHVPRQAYRELLRADSKGAYFNRHVRSVFRYARLHPGCSVDGCPSPLS
jgi:hypothetical protein